MNFKDLRIAILGAGKSGIASARELDARGAHVLISDKRGHDELGTLIDGLSASIEVETGGHTDRVLNCDIMIISPGVSVHNDYVQRALKSGIKVMGEVEIAWRLSPVPFLAVTGTNGKSTTVTLLNRMLGEKSILAGNIGNPLVAEVSSAPEGGYVVAEVSSFQLETVYDFRPHVAVLTNITPDHLDRHPNLDEYYAAKARLFANQGPSDLAIFSDDDEGARRMCAELAEGRLPAWLEDYPAPKVPACPKILRFSAEHSVERGAWFENGWIYWRDNGPRERVVKWGYNGLPGRHNLLNALGAIAAAKWLGVANDDIEAALAAHKPLHHRVEFVREYQGVKFFDDSKGTNPGAVCAVLRSFDEPVVLIAGGKDKGSDFTELGRTIAERVKTLVLIGEAADRLEANVRKAGGSSIVRCATLREAAETAWQEAKPCGVVLLSPACSSFDMFNNAEERGRLFAEYAMELS